MAKNTSYHSKYKGVIVSKTDMRKLKKGLEAKMKGIADFIISRLSQIGEECVRIARESGDYNDITGNLRSSIGYVILYDGKPVQGGDFAAVPVQPGIRNIKMPDGSIRKIKVGGDGAAGQRAGQELLEKLQAKFPWGIVLIVCAGMKYAAYVEAVHHKDVLTSAEQECESMVSELLKGLVK